MPNCHLAMSRAVMRSAPSTRRERRRSPPILPAHAAPVGPLPAGCKRAGATLLGCPAGPVGPVDPRRGRSTLSRRRSRRVELKPRAVSTWRPAPRAAPVQVGTDMLFEQIPAYWEYFGFGTATPEELHAVS